MMRDSIFRFPEQFAFEPVVEHADRLPTERQRVVVLGMGGSQLPATLVSLFAPSLDIVSHRDYGLPALADEELRGRLIIASSYSGNTEEVLDGMEQARARGLSLAAVSVGGALIERAKQYGIPYVQLPNTGIQPRCALGFSVRGLFALLGLAQELRASTALATTLDAATLEEPGRMLARELKDRVPVIYASNRNAAVAYIWKIKCNETGKIPAFCNVIPELNHNEMNGFDVVETTRHLSDRFMFLFLRDADDHPRNLARMDVLKKLYTDRGLPVREIQMLGATMYTKVFSSILLADWTSMYIAEELYGLESEPVPMVEEFKRLIA